jgi:prophage regulatory protein
MLAGQCEAPTSKLLRLPQVMDRVGLRTTRIYELMGDGSFPKSIRLGERAVVWLESYQREQIADIATEMHSGHTRILAQAPTGAGKTNIIATVVMAAAAAELRALVLATRTRLVRQIHERLEAFDIRHGVIAAPLPQLRNYSARVQVASVDTLYRRAILDT